MEIPEDKKKKKKSPGVLIKDPRKRRKCPLCWCNMYLYNLPSNTMILMCENVDCDYPFGYEALQIVHFEHQLEDNPLKATNDFFEYPEGGVDGVPATPLPSNTVTSGSMATIPSSVLSDLTDYDQSSLGDCDTTPITKDDVTLSARLSKQDKKRKGEKVANQRIKRTLENVKTNNLELRKPKGPIMTEKWLKNMLVWERHTGKEYLTNEEKMLLKKKEEATFGNGELKISVNPQGEVPIVCVEVKLNEEVGKK